MVTLEEVLSEIRGQSEAGGPLPRSGQAISKERKQKVVGVLPCQGPQQHLSSIVPVLTSTKCTDKQKSLGTLLHFTEKIGLAILDLFYKNIQYFQAN
jgi:hypothetical protein